MYSAGVISKVCKSFKKTGVVHDQYQCSILEEILKQGKNLEFDKVFVSQAYNGSLEELLEKIVILSHLDDKFIRFWIEQGFNPLENMFLGEIKCSVKELQAGFEYFNSYYRSYLTKSLIKDIERIPFLSKRGRNVISLNESVKEIEKREGSIVVGLYQQRLREKFICDMLTKQIIMNINKRISQGISQDQEIIALKQIENEAYSGFNVEILKKLVTEANLQLRLMKLPKEFRKYEDMLYSKVSVETFYSHLKTATIPDFEKNEILGAKFYNSGEDGASFALIGDGEPPPELKNKTLDEIENLGVKKVYETPMDLDGTPSMEDFKDVRKKIKFVMDGLDSGIDGNKTN